MKKLALALMTAGTLAMPVAYAASPLSITFSGEGTGAKGAYETHEVKCSDARMTVITLWKDSKEWCVGDQGSEKCSSKKIKAAKAACK